MTTRSRCSTITIVTPDGVDPPDHLDRVVDLGRVEPGERLVEQQHLRVGREGAGHLQQLALVQVDLGRVGVGAGVEPDQLEVRPAPCCAPSAERPRRRPNMIAIATLSRTVIDSNGRGIW